VGARPEAATAAWPDLVASLDDAVHRATGAAS
jgi:hypothetical protein